MPIEHVIFDAFGTIVKRKKPFSLLRLRAHVPAQFDWDRAMLQSFDWSRAAEGTEYAKELQEDLDGVQMFDDMPQAFEQLKTAGVSWSVMSNLASCYGPPLQKALSPFDPGQWFLSYENGMKKPNPDYYRYALKALGFTKYPEKVVFIGDHARHDVLGPALEGMNALRVRRENLSMAQLLNNI